MTKENIEKLRSLHKKLNDYCGCDYLEACTCCYAQTSQLAEVVEVLIEILEDDSDIATITKQKKK